MIKCDTLVVGAGLSGLAITEALVRQGADVQLIEALPRLGGRILTHQVDAAAFDLGPAWFWPGQPRMAALVQRFDIPVFEQFAQGDLMFQTQSGTTERGRGFASMEGSYRLHGGMGALVDGLSTAIGPNHIQTDTRLTALRHNAQGLTATLTKDGTSQTITARSVVLALPPRVVADTIRFDPPLSPDQNQALQTIPTWMAGQAKIIAVYDTPHWRTAGLSGDAMSQRGPMVEIHDASPAQSGPYALFGFVGVPPAARATHKDALKDMAKAQLVALFGPEMANPKALLLQDWAELPEITRASDHAPLRHHPAYGLPSDLTALQTHGIHFAGTETAPEFGGYLEGALEAAEQTVKALHTAVPTA